MCFGHGKNKITSITNGSPYDTQMKPVLAEVIQRAGPSLQRDLSVFDRELTFSNPLTTRVIGDYCGANTELAANVVELTGIRHRNLSRVVVPLPPMSIRSNNVTGTSHIQ